MTTIKVIFFGMMLAWMPSLILLAYLLWREGVGHRTDRGDRLRSLFLSHGLEFGINHLIPTLNNQIQPSAENTRTVAQNRASRTRRSFRQYLPGSNTPFATSDLVGHP